MDSITIAEAARRLGTNAPRVRRTVARLGISRPRGEPLSPRQFEQLRAQLGSMRKVGDLSRIETQTLAALSRASLGLISVRAVARRAGVSPTAAGRAVLSLEACGLVNRKSEWITAGRARLVEIIFAGVTSSQWPGIAGELAQVRAPTRASAACRQRRVPFRLRHLFWNADLRRLDVFEHGAYIAERLLSTQDLNGLAWGLSDLRAADWERAAQNRGLTPAERAMALNFAAAARD